MAGPVHTWTQTWTMIRQARKLLLRPVNSAGTGPDPDGASVWKTQVIEEHAKSILSRNQSPDVPSAYRSILIGAASTAVFIVSRGPRTVISAVAGLDFESKIFAKVNAPELLRQELAKASHVPEPIALGVNTDAYQPCERELRLTRRVLEVLNECQHPVALITKSSLIERDIDLLAEMASRRLAMAAVTLTTLDSQVARTLEPRAAAPLRRLRTIRALTDAGIPVGVSIAPVIPFVTEPDLERILAAAAEAGAVNAGYVTLRLPWEVSPLFRQWLEAHFPDRAARVMNRVRDIRGGKDYDCQLRQAHAWGRSLGRSDSAALRENRRPSRHRRPFWPLPRVGYLPFPPAFNACRASAN